MTTFEKAWTGLATVITLALVFKPTNPCTLEYKELVLTVTSYRPIPAQTDSSPNWTSTGSPAVMGICAASRDLLSDGRLHYGDIVEVPKLGVYKVMDTMNKRHKNHIDILVYTVTQERIVGWRKQVSVKVIYDITK